MTSEFLKNLEYERQVEGKGQQGNTLIESTMIAMVKYRFLTETRGTFISKRFELKVEHHYKGSWCCGDYADAYGQKLRLKANITRERDR